MKRLFAFLLVIILLGSLPICVLASDVEGSAADPSASEPETSTPAEITIKDLNDNVSVIQSQLWIILIAGLFFLIYKCFRFFF